jgi:hypothetical protein
MEVQEGFFWGGGEVHDLVVSGDLAGWRGVGGAARTMGGNRGADEDDASEIEQDTTSCCAGRSSVNAALDINQRMVVDLVLLLPSNQTSL